MTGEGGSTASGCSDIESDVTAVKAAVLPVERHKFKNWKLMHTK